MNPVASSTAPAPRVRVMGVLNLTPDSFYDGGRFNSLDQAIAQAERLAEEGADIIDVGGESTRPGATPIGATEEAGRVVPLIAALQRRYTGCISVDTSKPEVMRAAVEAGARMINDVWALRQPGALETACQLGVPVCLMHMQGEPRTMQQAPEYSDVLGEVCRFLEERAAACLQAGMRRDQIVLDPGFGFGKGLDHNLALMRGLPQLAALGYPVLVGVSRKSMIGTITRRPAEQRLPGSLAMAAYAALNGAGILRVHDVAATVDVVRVLSALIEREANG